MRTQNRKRSCPDEWSDDSLEEGEVEYSPPTETKKKKNNNNNNNNNSGSGGGGGSGSKKKNKKEMAKERKSDSFA